MAACILHLDQQNVKKEEYKMLFPEAYSIQTSPVYSMHYTNKASE